MARPPSQSVTEAEQAILEVLWALGEGSVRDVANGLAPSKPLAYTTVLTMLGVLHKKDLVVFRQEGRAFIYRPTLTKAEVRDRAVHNLMAQLFDGSPDALAVHLLEHHDIDPARIDALRDKVRRARPKAGK